MPINPLKSSFIAVLLVLGLVIPSTAIAVSAATISQLMPRPAQSGWNSVAPVFAKKDKADKHKKGNQGKGKGKKEKQGKPDVDPIATNAVSVSCVDDAANGGTACTFVATGPKGPSKIKILYVPESVACSTVIDTSGSGATIDDLPAFASRKNQPELTVILSGAVSTGGSATYWVEAGKQLVPVEGPGLSCEQPTRVSATARAVPETPATETVATQTVPVSPTPEPTKAVETGSIQIRALACPGAMTETEPDWFRSCPDGADGLKFRLAQVDSGANGLTAVTDVSGTVHFANLTPGTYELNLVDIDWCHAVSNSVDDSGDLVVTAGAEVTVWIFTCQ